MARRKRTNLIILGVTLAVLAGIITVGALTEDDDSGKPNDRQAAAAGPVVSSLASTDGDAEEIATPSNSSATPTPATEKPTTTGATTEKPTTTAPATEKPTTTAPADDDDDAGSGDDDAGLDPRFSTCAKANDAGYGPYYRGKDPEYAWYRDRDEDGIVCEQ